MNSIFFVDIMAKNVDWLLSANSFHQMSFCCHWSFDSRYVKAKTPSARLVIRVPTPRETTKVFPCHKTYFKNPTNFMREG